MCIRDRRYTPGDALSIFHSETVTVGGSDDEGGGWRTLNREDNPAAVQTVVNGLWTPANIISYREEEDSSYSYPGDTIMLNTNTQTIGDAIDDATSIDVSGSGLYDIEITSQPDWVDIGENATGYDFTANEATDTQRSGDVVFTKGATTSTLTLIQAADLPEITNFSGEDVDGVAFNITGDIADDANDNNTFFYGKDWTFSVNVDHFGSESVRLEHADISGEGGLYNPAAVYAAVVMTQDADDTTLFTVNTDDAFGYSGSITDETTVAVRIKVGDTYSSHDIYIGVRT